MTPLSSRCSQSIGGAGSNVIYATALIIEEEQNDFEAIILACVQALLAEGRKRKQAAENNPNKRRYIFWDHSWAHESILANYLGPLPRFNGDNFTCMFRISRANYGMIRNVLYNSDLFCDSYDA